MNGAVWILASIGVPVVMGLVLLCVPSIRKRSAVVGITAAGLVMKIGRASCRERV